MSRVRNEISARLPAYADHIVTMVTGCPAETYRSREWPAAMLCAAPIFAMTAAAACLYIATTTASILWGAPLLLAALLVFSGSMRYVQTVLLHHASHNTLFDAKSSNRRYSVLSSVLLILPSPEEYIDSHGIHHKTSRIFGTAEDPDAAFLFELGFRPGTPVARLKLNLLLTLINPKFHAVMAYGRIRSACAGSWRRTLFVIMVLAGLVFSTVLNPYFGFALAFAFFPLTHCAALLQFCSEHLWFSPQIPGETTKERIIRLSHARYCGDPVPAADTVTAWVIWWLRLFCLHLPIRILCLNGDLPQHDMHHLLVHENFQHLGERRWRLDPSEYPLREYWGYAAALHAVLKHIEGAEQCITATTNTKPSSSSKPAPVLPRH